MQFDWHYLLSLFVDADFWLASWVVVKLSLLTWGIGIVLGLLVALGKQSRFMLLRKLCGFYIWLFRSLPLLVLLIFIFNLPQIFPFTSPLLSDPFMAGLIAMVLSETAYIAEIHRGGLLSVSRGQQEAGRALGLRIGQIQLNIIIPQALRISLPTLVNEYIAIVKQTSLVSVISLSEILMVGERLYTDNFKVLETLLAVACYYVLIVSVFEKGIGWFERRSDIYSKTPLPFDAAAELGVLAEQPIVAVHTSSASAKPILEMSSISKAYNGKKVLKDINLSVKPGEIVSIIGPSGSGKTTLIRTINGLETLDGGEIRLLGREFIQAGQKENSLAYRSQVTRLGMVFQGFNLFPHKTVLQNLMLAPKLHGIDTPKEIRERSILMLEKVGMLDHANKYPHQLSGGQQQRVAIARTLVMKPTLVLFDEPTSALDPERVNEVLQVIEKLAQEGITMLIVTHEMQFAFSISDRVVFMEQGEIIHDEAPDVLRTMKSERMSRFLKNSSFA
ncbi:amino acid ABC transporter permease/ATP-binding protein [Rouxiella sp. Mn2063]|uniref:amino acid ABC transporter permease/ATP-binding protein n=1 Tax=Rouxiella sp. Mn2063 TaxID=3395262 RepID=UPI003BE5C38C